VIAEHLALRRDLSVLLVVILLLGLGEELWSRFLPKYLEVLGASALVIGLFGTLKDLLDAVYQYPGGKLSDRFGHRAALIVFNLLAALGYVIYLLSPNWEGIFLGTLFVAAWASLSLPATFSIIGHSLPTDRRAMGFAVQSIIRRVPIVIGPLLGGAIITALGIRQGIRLGLLASIVLALGSIAFQRRCYTRANGADPEQTPPRPRVVDLVRTLHPGLKRLLWADILARLAEGIPKQFIVLYALNLLRATPMQFGGLTALSMAVSIAVYIPVARLADRSPNRHQYVALTFLFFALSPLAVVLSRSVPMLCIAFVVMGLREIAEPARKALIVDLSDARRRGTDVGVYYALRQFSVLPASLIGGLLWGLSPQAPFWVAFAVGIAGAIAFALSSRRTGGALSRNGSFKEVSS
jgi:MFS family permease